MTGTCPPTQPCPECGYPKLSRPTQTCWRADQKAPCRRGKDEPVVVQPGALQLRNHPWSEAVR